MTKRKNEGLCPPRKAAKPIASAALTAADVPTHLVARIQEFSAGMTSEECWPWPMSGVHGYGRWGTVRAGVRQNIFVARASYALTYGEASAGLVIRHRCDNPACFNPEHLIEGTQQDNINDMQERGRSMWSGTTPDCRRSLLQYLDGVRGRSQSRTVVAPDGRTWPSTGVAARDLGISQTGVAKLCRLQRRGWHYA